MKANTQERPRRASRELMSPTPKTTAKAPTYGDASTAFTYQPLRRQLCSHAASMYFTHRTNQVGRQAIWFSYA